MELYNFNSDAGELIGRLTQEKCMLACLQTEGCRSVDWNKLKGTCFMHDANSEPRQPNDCCLRFEFVCSNRGTVGLFRYVSAGVFF